MEIIHRLLPSCLTPTPLPSTVLSPAMWSVTHRSARDICAQPQSKLTPAYTFCPPKTNRQQSGHYRQYRTISRRPLICYYRVNEVIKFCSSIGFHRSATSGNILILIISIRYLSLVAAKVGFHNTQDIQRRGYKTTLCYVTGSHCSKFGVSRAHSYKYSETCL